MSATGDRILVLSLLAAGLLLVSLAAPRTLAFASMSAGDKTIVALGREMRPPPAALHRAIASREVARDWLSLPGAAAEIGGLYLELAQRQESPPRVRRAFLDHAIRALRTGLAGAPSRPYGWLQLAQAEAALGTGPARINALLRMTYRAAPAEPRIAFQRLRIGFAERSHLAGDVRRRLAGDVRLALRHYPGRLAAFARDRFALPWLRTALADRADLDARLAGAYLRLPAR